jgi:DNA-binding Xre family transcriptional regulator
MIKSADVLRNKLRAMRDVRGALAELASKVGMKPQAIYRIIAEDATGDISLSTLDRIALVLERDPWDLIRPDAAPPVPITKPEPTLADILAEIKRLRKPGDPSLFGPDQELEGRHYVQPASSPALTPARREVLDLVARIPEDKLRTVAAVLKTFAVDPAAGAAGQGNRG